MNDALFASIAVKSAGPAANVVSLVAELTGGAAGDRAVDTAWARIRIDDRFGDPEIWARDPDDFLGWPVLLEILPADDAVEDDVIPRVAALMEGLIGRGLWVRAHADYAERLPGAGEPVGPPPG